MAPVRLQELFALLRQDEYRTARQLAGQLGVSEKTVRTRLRELNDELEKNGAKVVSRARFGYRLEVVNLVPFEAWQSKKGKGEPLENAGERSDYLMACLLIRPFP